MYATWHSYGGGSNSCEMSEDRLKSNISTENEGLGLGEERQGKHDI